MSHRVAFGTLPPTPAAAPGPKQESVTGAFPPSPPMGASVIAFRARAAADPFDFLNHHPGLSAADIGILRGVLLAPGVR
jgi:hypothetical protein